MGDQNHILCSLSDIMNTTLRHIFVMTEDDPIDSNRLGLEFCIIWDYDFKGIFFI